MQPFSLRAGSVLSSLDVLPYVLPVRSLESRDLARAWRCPLPKGPATLAQLRIFFPISRPRLGLPFNRQDHGRITLHSSQCPPLPVAPVRPPSCLGASVPVGLGALWLLAPTRPSCPASHRRTTPSLHAFVTCVAPRVAHEMQRSGQPGVGLRAMLALEHTLRMRYVIHAFRCRKEVHQTLLCIVRQ
jgi:hypothetical protein